MITCATNSYISNLVSTTRFWNKESLKISKKLSEIVSRSSGQNNSQKEKDKMSNRSTIHYTYN